MHPHHNAPLSRWATGLGQLQNSHPPLNLQAVTVTPRHLESLIRLSEALAQSRFSEKVGIAFIELVFDEDAISTSRAY
ncbi:hypothetical protein BC332_15360 [Capsicum chinense]|nr:hypothetical protein BC332_15360 [Capsicum chinense]